MVNCRENIALSGKHKPLDGQTTPTMYVYHYGGHDLNVQKFEHQRDTVWFANSIRGQLYRKNG